MEPSWAPGLKALVRRHRYDFAAAAAEVALAHSDTLARHPWGERPEVGGRWRIKARSGEARSLVTGIPL